MSEENSKEADTKKTPAKKAGTRSTAATSKTTKAKSAAKKTAARKTPAKKSTTTKPTTAKTTKPRTKAATTTPEKTKADEDKAKENSTQKITDTTENASAKEEAHFDTKNSNQTDNKPDTAQIIDDLKGRDWPQIIKRALLMFFFGVLGSFALYLSFVLAVAQVGFSIFLGQPNEALTRVMRQCALYIRDVLDYLSFASDECPFPFGRDLPDADQ